MTRRMAPKPFQPKPGNVGARITWTHFDPAGERLERSGTIVSLAPKTQSVTMGFWVVPDQADARDLYPIVYVGKASSYSPAHGAYLDGAGNQYADKGSLFASWHEHSPTGQMTALAKPRRRPVA